jgi:hypothetical protein
MSAFGLLDPAQQQSGLRRLRAVLESGAWAAQHGELRGLPELDCGRRIIIAQA